MMINNLQKRKNKSRFIDDKNMIISIEGYDFIKLDLRGLNKAVHYKYKNPKYSNFIGWVMLIVASKKYEVYLPVPRRYPRIFYRFFRQSIILDSLLFQFNGHYVGFHEKFHPFLFKNNKYFYKKVGDFKFYDFSILNYMDLS